MDYGIMDYEWCFKYKGFNELEIMNYECVWGAKVKCTTSFKVAWAMDYPA